MKKKTKKHGDWKAVMVSFTVLYLMSMGTATYLMEIKFADEFKDNAALHLSSVQRQIENDLGSGENKPDTAYYGYIASQLASAETPGRFQQFSIAFYQTDGSLLAKTEERLANDPSNIYTLEDLTIEDKEILAKYGEQTLGSAALSGAPPKYRISTRVSKDTKRLCQIIVQEIAWEQEDADNTDGYTDPVSDSIQLYENEQGTGYIETGSKIVWEWGHQESRTETRAAHLLFPCLDYGGYDQWLKWNRNAYLQGSDSKTDLSQKEIERVLAAFSAEDYTLQTQDVLYTSIWPDIDAEQPACYAALRFESHPWLAAADHLKYGYLMGLALMVVCIAKVISATNKTYRQRAALEDMRRDFTNAMAHELKTPLSIIRGFAENLQEHHMEEKRDYYLTQIIRQTEEIDRLTAEMIEVSKMDSEHLALQKEPVSMYRLLKTQMERLEPMRLEKNIQIQYACKEDFIINGDPGYLAKAVWNLLSNAIVYNIQDGSIQIRTDAKSCTITNTGTPLTEEQLTHAFNMFYSGDKSRSAKDKHMGLGAFLAKKILELHGLKIALRNTREGIQVSIAKPAHRHPSRRR